MGAKAALPELEKTRGCIVFTASISGLFAGYGGFLYVPAKHAVVGLTRQLAYELGPTIRVNAVAPGGIATNLQGLRALGQRRDDASRGRRDAADYAGLYVMLASEKEGGALNGAVLLADSGSSLRRSQGETESTVASEGPRTQPFQG